MTYGQQRAIRELERLKATDSNVFDLVGEPFMQGELLIAKISIHLGAIEIREGGLDLREREELILRVSPDYPFDCPRLYVEHTRFAGFAHVIWNYWLCLYQSSLEWNPSDGLYGFFERLMLWLGKAAINEMDPIEGPLEPPHHDTDFSQKPFVVRANAPCAAGERWVGLAILEKHANRTELIGWNDLSSGWPTNQHLAFAIMLPDALPMEFPTNGGEFFREVQKAGMERQSILTNLALASLFSQENEPMHLVLGFPMRRAKDGTRRIHIAVWTVDAETAKILKNLLPEHADSEQISKLRAEVRESLAKLFEERNLKWCQVLEDRQEIIVRRDDGTPISWFAGKSILILGCGALGSWAAEIVARAGASSISLVDHAKVKPGILTRQNFELQDIGANKVDALGRRLVAITKDCAVVSYARDAHAFAVENEERFRAFDMVLDCTASPVFQMKLERDWGIFSGHTPPIVSFVIDSQARHCLSVVVPPDSGGGIWDGYLLLKTSLCTQGNHSELTKAFYSERAIEKLFQPEPGCSDPTFIGSTADVVSLVSEALNTTIQNQNVERTALGVALSTSRRLDLIQLPEFVDTVAGKYRVRIAKSIFTKAGGWVKQNSRRRGPGHETGGLLWGFWDDAVQVIWLFDLSGPPSDSKYDPSHFICGIKGTAEEHKRRKESSYGAVGFVGHWHTHPDLPSHQSPTDIATMATLVSSLGQNQKRSLMLIFGRTRGLATAGLYVYESDGSSHIAGSERVLVGTSQLNLATFVV